MLIGWSLGGAIATLLADAAPRHIAGLITIATNPCFVERPDWQHGMPAAQFAQFSAGLDQDGADTLRRFAALQAHGDRAARESTRALRAASEACAGQPALVIALAMLAALDVRTQLASLAQPVLHILGAQDAIVSPHIAQYHHASSAHPGVLLIEATGHAPFLSAEATVAARIVDFTIAHCTQPQFPQRDKHLVAQSFGRAALSYDGVAEFQRDIGAGLLQRLPHRAATQVLDMGCGTGATLAALGERYPQSAVMALDIAEDMLRAARTRSTAARWLCADAESLPLADGCVDVMFSNLALQWCEDLRAAFGEFARVLAPNGDLLLSTLGPDTLWELRAAWRTIDKHEHVNRFATAREIEEAAAAAGLQVVKMHQTFASVATRIYLRSGASCAARCAQPQSRTAGIACRTRRVAATAAQLR